MIYHTKEKITELLNEERYEEAINAVLSGDDRVVPKAEAYRIAGMCYYALGNLEYARIYLDVSSQLEPENLETLYALGRVSTDEGKFEEAEAFFREILRSRSVHTHIWLHIGMMRLRRGMKEEALMYFFEVIYHLKNGYNLSEETTMRVRTAYEDTDDPALFYAVTANAVGKVYLEKGNVHQAGGWFMEAIVNKPLGIRYDEPYRHMERVRRLMKERDADLKKASIA
jgi:tetratricopeptide (TPR) repeat protein